MKFVILDAYPPKKYRLVKDTAGGYGTGNDFGNTIFSKLLNLYVDKSIGMPAMEVMYISSILKIDNEVHYTRELDDPKINEADFVILPSSIIAHETETTILKKIKHKQVFVTGIFSNILRDKYQEDNTVIVKNEADTFFYNLQKLGKLNKEFLLSIFKDNTLINQFYSPVNLDDLPFPDWSEYSKRYPLRNDFFSLNQKIAVPILATRGCPYSCFNYCTYPLQQGRKVRARSVENLIKEIKHWQKEIGTNKFVFRDPVFSINRKHTISLCEEIIKQKLNITFMVETHLNNMDDQMIKLLKQAGLELIYVGVESSNHVVLKDMKRFTIEHDKQYEIIKKCQDAGIIVKTMFIIGNPEDTEDTINASIQYSKYLPSLYAQFSVFTPYPGTPVYSDFKELINVEELEKFNQYNLVFKHNIFTPKEIRKLLSKSYTMYYGRINWFLKFFKNFLLAN